MMKFILNFIATFSLTFLVSCSTTLDFHLPTQNFSSPEVVGKTLGYRIQGEYSNSTKFKLAKLEQASIFSSQINVSTDQGTNKDNALNLMGALGLGNSIEVFYRSYHDAPGMIGAKVQVIGRDSGKREEGVKLAFHGAYGTGEVDNKSITATNGSGGSRSYNGILDIDAFEVGSTLGYRYSKNVLPYIAFNYRSFDATGELTSETLPNETITGVAKVESLQLGMILSRDVIYLQLEGGYAGSTWKNAEKRDDYTLGFSIGLRSL